MSTELTTPRAVMQDTAPLDFAGLVAMGEHLVKTGFLPSHVRTGAQVAAIVMTGRELGMTPMRALRSLVMVKGKVTESADSVLARFKSDGGRAQFKALDETQAVLWLRHPNGDEHVESFTLADAKRAGIASEMYSKYPRAMLRSRAITAGLKSLGWEGGSGVYDPAELADPAPALAPAPALSVEPDEPTPLTDAEVMNDRSVTLEEAHTMLLRGKPLGAMSSERLSKAYEWAKEKAHARLAAACFLLLDQRAAEAAEAAVTAGAIELIEPEDAP
jgi:hypothetical protein